MKKYTTTTLLLCLIPLAALAQEEETPLMEFDAKYTTELYGSESKSDQQLLRLIEYSEARTFISETLEATILKESSGQPTRIENGYEFTINRDRRYWKIRIKPIAPFKYGVFDLRELKGDERPEIRKL